MKKHALALASLFIACSPPDLGTVQAEGACRNYASAYCTQLRACSAGLFDIRWPDLVTCTQYTTIQCINSTIAPASGQTAAKMQACTDVLQQGSSWSCSDLLVNVNPPAACAPATGSLANGAPCAKSTQCQSSYCSVPETGTCGTCAPQPPAGTACSLAATCGFGAYCNDQNVCTTRALPNEACSIHQVCQPGYNCVSNVCTLGQTDVGDECGVAGDPGCSEMAGLDCNAQVQSCQPMLLVAVGQPCGAVLFGQLYGHCGGAAQCVNGTCVATAGLGQPCDSNAGPFCISPARCITPSSSATSGTCTITDATTCN